MKPFKLTISVDGEGKSQLRIDGAGKAEVTKGQMIVYLAGELEKLEMEMVIDGVGKKMMQEAKKQMEGIRLVKNLPRNLKKQ